MALALKKEYTMDEFEIKYQEITRLYDYAEELVGTVENKQTADPQRQIEIVEPLINDMSDCADLLTKEFLFIAESKRYKSPSKASKLHIEASLRKIFAALNDYNARVRASAKKAQGAVANIADAVVKKIQRQVEEITLIFMEFIHISLSNIMGKMELEAIKVRDQRFVAMMMHQQAMMQQQ